MVFCCRKLHAGNNLHKMAPCVSFSRDSKVLREFLTVYHRFGATALKCVKRPDSCTYPSQCRWDERG